MRFRNYCYKTRYYYELRLVIVDSVEQDEAALLARIIRDYLMRKACLIRSTYSRACRLFRLDSIFKGFRFRRTK